jgi:hypothetical protein
MPTRDEADRIRYDRERAADCYLHLGRRHHQHEAVERTIEITEGDPNSCRMKFDHMNAGSAAIGIARSSSGLS